MSILRRTPPILLASAASASLLVGAVSARQAGGIFLPGTQPNVVQVTPPSVCQICHATYSTSNPGMVEPFDTWEGTMMANAARDPVFRAALAVANQDAPGSGEWCIRCHSPKGWLEGRSLPPDASALQGDDFASVQCDVCHRLVDPLSPAGQAMVSPPVNWRGNGMMVVDPGTPPAEPPKHGPYAGSFSPFHATINDPFDRQGELCGTCHDVSNPLMPGPGNPYDPQQAHIVERTFSEWKASAFYALGESGNCQSCHMKTIQPDFACSLGGAPLRNFLPTHDFTGGNAWVPDVIAVVYALNPAAYVRVKTRATATLQEAARLWVTTKPVAGAVVATVRVKNETGHKLPTGYPEGRRMWINVRGYDAATALVFESGEYDAATARLLHDPQEKVYEALMGQSGPQGCAPSFHFLLNYCVAKENRIPPRGFSNAAFAVFQGSPVGATYRDGQFWDDTVYVLPPSVVTVEANLRYQTSSRDYLEFLLGENVSDNWSNVIYNAWLATGKSSPVRMETFTSLSGPFVEAGPGSPGSGGFVPSLGAGGDPSPGRQLVFTLADGPGGAQAYFFFGWSLLSLPISCGTLYPFPDYVRSLPLEGTPGVPGGGAGEFEVSVPNDPNLPGLVVYAQVGVVDPGAPGLCTLSNGLVVTFQ